MTSIPQPTLGDSKKVTYANGLSHSRTNSRIAANRRVVLLLYVFDWCHWPTIERWLQPWKNVMTFEKWFQPHYYLHRKRGAAPQDLQRLRELGSAAYEFAYRIGQEERQQTNVEACIEIEGQLGDEHADDCDCVTTIEDECNCHLSRFRKAIEQIPLEDHNE